MKKRFARRWPSPDHQPLDPPLVRTCYIEKEHIKNILITEHFQNKYFDTNIKLGIQEHIRGISDRR